MIFMLSYLIVSRFLMLQCLDLIISVDGSIKVRIRIATIEYAAFRRHNQNVLNTASKAVGEQNYRWFLLFLFVHVIMW